MIQRVQSILLLFSIVSIVIIMLKMPIYYYENTEYLITNYKLLQYLLFAATILSAYALFQYKNLNRQRMIISFARLLITVVLVLSIFLYKEEKELGFGFFSLIIPFIFLLSANFFIKKDQNLIKSADRIR